MQPPLGMKAYINQRRKKGQGSLVLLFIDGFKFALWIRRGIYQLPITAPQWRVTG